MRIERIWLYVKGGINVKKKLLIFPYDYQVDTIVSLSGGIKNFEIVGICSVKEDEELLKKTFQNLQCSFSEGLSRCDCVLFLNNNRNLNLINYLKRLNDAFLCNKKVLMSGKLVNSLLELERILADNVYIIDRKQEIQGDDFTDLKEIDIPVVNILGMGENCSKFEVEIQGKMYFEMNGYKVLAFGGNEMSFLFGIENYPNFLYDKKFSLPKKVIAFNNFISDKISIDKPDIILLGSPGGILPVNGYIHNFYGEMPYILGNATNIDLGILCTYFAVDMDEEYLRELQKLCKYRYNTPIAGFYVSEKKMKTDMENKYELGIYHFDKKLVNNLLLQSSALENVIFCNNKDNSITKIWNLIETTLKDNVKIAM